MAVSSAVWVIMRERLCEACSCFNAQRKVAICDVFIFRQMHSWWVAFCFMICLNESKVLSHSFIDSFMSEPVELLRIFFFAQKYWQICGSCGHGVEVLFSFVKPMKKPQRNPTLFTRWLYVYFSPTTDSSSCEVSQTQLLLNHSDTLKGVTQHSPNRLFTNTESSRENACFFSFFLNLWGATYNQVHSIIRKCWCYWNTNWMAITNHNLDLMTFRSVILNQRAVAQTWVTSAT